MSRISRGLYQSLITEALSREMESLEKGLLARSAALHYADVADRIATHVAYVINRAIECISDGQKVEQAVELAKELITLIAKSTDSEVLSDRPKSPGRFLTGVLAIQPDGQPEALSEPLIPLLDTTLLTNAPGEPRVGHQILAEIPSADRIDVVMAFIRRSGIRPMLDALRRHCEAGRKLRVLTTVYTGSTEADALEELRGIGAEVRVSYDTDSTRLHAKAWLFHRQSGFSTAYVGSSNLTYSAQISGLEWNARFSAARNNSVVEKISAVFDSYWHSEEFAAFSLREFSERGPSRSGAAELTYLSPIELRPEPFQERMLEQIELSRQRGFHRNLLVSATGTGKTVMAAIDYVRLRELLPRSRLLFVAHRNEILQQSLSTFRFALRDSAFGEPWVDGNRPEVFDHVFASIQSLGPAVFERLDPGHFDVVIIDEFHHAAARSYRRLLERIRPTELLGLTATPERNDGLPLLHWFDNRIAAELRLWDAIDQQRLVPFTYYGVSDNSDFTSVPWHRGRGYDVEGLTNVFTADDAWARQVIAALAARVDDIRQIRALGFCVSIDHARFMARVFNAANIPSTAIWADTPRTDREMALRDLKERRVNVVFSVDIFNEGVDVPSVDTLIMLRPTDSPVLFLQQLGRGLRRYPGKRTCLVVDFVGLHNQEFRFDRKLGAILGGTRKEIERQVMQGFPFLPAGCHMELDRIASERVLRGIRNAVPDRWSAKVEELRRFARGRKQVTLADYLGATGLSLEDIYGSDRSWSDLLTAADVPVLGAGPAEPELRKAVGRLLHVDDARRIDTYTRFLRQSAAPAAGTTDSCDRRYFRMLVASVIGSACGRTDSLQQAANLIWRHPQVIAELLELMALLPGRIQHASISWRERPTLPLSVHARYTRIEIQAAFGDGTAARVPVWREGVRWMKAEECDVFLFTLDKTSGRFSPTTRYRDFAVSRDLIHWESQSTTRADSPTGRRYQSCVAGSSAVMLFARLRDDDRAFYFLGPAHYESHESEMPMAIKWRLRYPLPGDLFQSFAAAIA